MEKIISVVCNYYNITWTMFYSNGKKRVVTEPREVVSYLAKIILKLEQKQTGFMIGKDHSTVAYYIKTVEGFIENNPDFRCKIDEIILKLK